MYPFFRSFFTFPKQGHISRKKKQDLKTGDSTEKRTKGNSRDDSERPFQIDSFSDLENNPQRLNQEDRVSRKAGRNKEKE